MGWSATRATGTEEWGSTSAPFKRRSPFELNGVSEEVGAGVRSGGNEGVGSRVETLLDHLRAHLVAVDAKLVHPTTKETVSGSLRAPNPAVDIGELPEGEGDFSGVGLVDAIEVERRVSGIRVVRDYNMLLDVKDGSLPRSKA